MPDNETKIDSDLEIIKSHNFNAVNVYGFRPNNSNIEDYFFNKSGELGLKIIFRVEMYPPGFNYTATDADYILNKYYEASLIQEQSQEAALQKEKASSGMPKNIKKLIDSSVLIVLLFLFLIFVFFFLQKKEPSPISEKSQPTPLPKQTSLPVQEKKPLPPPEPEALLEEKEAKEINIPIINSTL